LLLAQVLKGKGQPVADMIVNHQPRIPGDVGGHDRGEAASGAHCGSFEPKVYIQNGETAARLQPGLASGETQAGSTLQREGEAVTCRLAPGTFSSDAAGRVTR
jgi:hypothetical protein